MQEAHEAIDAREEVVVSENTVVGFIESSGFTVTQQPLAVVGFRTTGTAPLPSLEVVDNAIRPFTLPLDPSETIIGVTLSLPVCNPGGTSIEVGFGKAATQNPDLGNGQPHVRVIVSNYIITSDSIPGS